METWKGDGIERETHTQREGGRVGGVFLSLSFLFSFAAPKAKTKTKNPEGEGRRKKKTKKEFIKLLALSSGWVHSPQILYFSPSVLFKQFV